MQVKKPFKFLLRLTPHQQTLCGKFAGCCRFIWNKSLALKNQLYEKEKTSLSQFDLNNLLIEWKTIFEWLKDSPSQSLQQTNKDLNQAFVNFFRKNADCPKYKKKGKHDAFRLPQGIKLLPSLSHKVGVVQLPKLGEVRFTKTQEIEGKIKHVTISKTVNKWYISFNCDNVDISALDIKPVSEIGIDRGIKIFGKCSNGNDIEGKEPLKKNRKKLTKLQRNLARKRKFSSNWKKAKTRIQKCHIHIKNIRYDYLHKSTTQLAKNHSLIVLEDLKIKNMSKSAKGTIENPGKNVKAKSGLNRAILDQGWYTFFVFLSYKSKWYGAKLVTVSPHYTSQKCSKCGYIDSRNRKSQSAFKCIRCGFALNADLNAARNILAEGHSVATSGTACGGDPLGSAVKQELDNRRTSKIV